LRHRAGILTIAGVFDITKHGVLPQLGTDVKRIVSPDFLKSLPIPEILARAINSQNTHVYSLKWK